MRGSRRRFKRASASCHRSSRPWLRRRLRQEGTSFDAIKDEVRHAAARELLMLGALGIADIAFTLDYGSVSSFVHAFRRWSGMPPGLWRQSQSGHLSLGA